MEQEAFVYLWYAASKKKYYLGSHNGKKPYYTHSATTCDELCSIVPHSKKPIRERREFFENMPKGVSRRILARGTDIEMKNLENALLNNCKERCWDRYYNVTTSFPPPPMYGEDHHLFGRTGENHPRYGKKLTPESLEKMSGENHHHFGKKQSTESNLKRSKAMSGENHPMHGKKQSTESNLKRSKAMSGKKHTQETKEKLSESLREYHAINGSESHPMYGKKQSTESNLKRSETLKEHWANNDHPKSGKKDSLETKKRKSEAKSGDNNPMSRKNREARQRKKQLELEGTQ